MPDTAIDQIPRRSRLDKLTPAEAAIRAAEEAVEAVPAADPLLTEAGQLLGFARARVADFVDRDDPTQANVIGYPRLVPPSPWRPIEEHDGTDALCDLIVDGKRWPGYRLKNGRWERPQGWPVVISVLLAKPSHFMTVPAFPGGGAPQDKTR